MEMTLSDVKESLGDFMERGLAICLNPEADEEERRYVLTEKGKTIQDLFNLVMRCLEIRHLETQESGVHIFFIKT
jgi:hypothetical protein